MTFWNPLTCLTGCLVIYAIGEFLSKKTKGVVSSLLFTCILFLAGFWTGILPADITTQSGLTTVMSNFGTALMITNIATLIDLEELISEWKTVVIALCSIAAIALICFTVGSWRFGREYALIAAPPVAGATVAGIIVTAAAEAAQRPELAAFAVLVLSFQKFFGIPVSTWGIRKDLKEKLANGYFDTSASARNRIKLPSMRIFPETPKHLRSSIVYLTKVAIVACIADFAGKATLIPGSDPANYWLNPNIACLLFGMIFARLGFLEKDIFVKSGSSGIITFGLLLMLPGSLAKVSPSSLLQMIVPTFGILILCSIGIVLVCGLVGKFLGYSPTTSAAIGATCMLAHPATQIISTECVESTMENATEEQRKNAMDYILPKMIVGGFVTVTIASVAFASLIGPMIFQ